jgi:hypothetical protein
VVGLAASLSAGALLDAVGWRTINALLLPWLLAAIVAISWLAYARRHAQRPAP